MSSYGEQARAALEADIWAWLDSLPDDQARGHGAAVLAGFLASHAKAGLGAEGAAQVFYALADQIVATGGGEP